MTSGPFGPASLIIVGPQRLAVGRHHQRPVVALVRLNNGALLMSDNKKAPV